MQIYDNHIMLKNNYALGSAHESTASKSMSNLSRIYDLSCRIFGSCRTYSKPAELN